MGALNRRDFIRSTAGVVAAGVAAPSIAKAAPAMPVAATKVALGNTGVTPSLLGMGTGVSAWNFDSEAIRRGKQKFVNNLIHAYDRGIRYFDLADMYGSHRYMCQAMRDGKMDRGEMTLLSKTISTTGKEVRDDVHRFIADLDAEYMDIVLLHCMQSGDWTEKMASCMDALDKLKEEGKVKAVGVSCHNFDAMKVASEHPWVDVMLARINPYGLKMDGSVDEVQQVLETSCDNDKGILGMKIFGEGIVAKSDKEFDKAIRQSEKDGLTPRMELITDDVRKNQEARMLASLKFAMGLPCVQAFTIGMVEQHDIDDTLAKIDAVAKSEGIA